MLRARYPKGTRVELVYTSDPYTKLQPGTKGTVEFRLFNGTTHAGKIKAYIQFCLAMSAWAINAKDSYSFQKLDGRDKAKAFEDLLTRRLKMRGKEFKTARLHLMNVFENTAAA